MTYRTSSSAHTKRIAAGLARRLAKSVDKARPRRATFVLLKGELGAGKTTFSQGFFRALGVRGRITSPTFILMKRYKLRGGAFDHGYHLDCYRLASGRELTDLGFKNVAADPRAVILIEWPERVRILLPQKAVRIDLRHGGREKERVIRVSGLPATKRRLYQRSTSASPRLI